MDRLTARCASRVDTVNAVDFTKLHCVDSVNSMEQMKMGCRPHVSRTRPWTRLLLLASRLLNDRDMMPFCSCNLFSFSLRFHETITAAMVGGLIYSNALLSSIKEATKSSLLPPPPVTSPPIDRLRLH